MFGRDDEELPGSAPLIDGIHKTQSEMDCSEEKEQELLEEVAKAVTEYRRQFKLHADNPTHADVKAAMKVAGDKGDDYKQTTGLPEIYLKQRLDTELGMGLGGEKPPGISVFTDEFKAQYAADHDCEVPTKQPDQSSTSGPSQDSAVTGNQFGKPLDFYTWYNIWRSGQSDSSELELPLKHLPEHMSWLDDTTNSQREKYSLAGHTSLAASTLEVPYQSTQMERAKSAYEMYERSFNTAVKDVSEAFKKSLVDTTPQSSSTAHSLPGME